MKQTTNIQYSFNDYIEDIAYSPRTEFYLSVITAIGLIAGMSYGLYHASESALPCATGQTQCSEGKLKPSSKIEANSNKIVVNKI